MSDVLGERDGLGKIVVREVAGPTIRAAQVPPDYVMRDIAEQLAASEAEAKLQRARWWGRLDVLVVIGVLGAIDGALRWWLA